MTMTSLEMQILRRQIKLAEDELRRLEGIPVPTYNELEHSDIPHIPVNSGPEYLTVLSSLWEKPILTLEDGTVLKCLDQAREQRDYSAACDQGDWS